MFKQLQAIALSFLFMLPSLGLHIDFTHCCGDIQGLGISHEVNINISACCDLEEAPSCADGTEFSQPPEYQNLAISNSVNAPQQYFTFSSRVSFGEKATLRFNSIYSKAIELKPSPPHISLFQVFLC